MISFQYGGRTGRRFTLVPSDEHLVVRSCDREVVREERPFEVAAISSRSRTLLSQFELVTRFREAGVDVLRAKQRRGSRALRDSARAALKKENNIEFAGRVLIDPKSARPVIYTENLFVKF